MDWISCSCCEGLVSVDEGGAKGSEALIHFIYLSHLELLLLEGWDDVSN